MPFLRPYRFCLLYPRKQKNSMFFPVSSPISQGKLERESLIWTRLIQINEKTKFVQRIFFLVGYYWKLFPWPSSVIFFFLSNTWFTDIWNTYIVFCLFRAAPAAYGGSQAKGQIGAVTAGLHHSRSNTESEPRLWPLPQITAMPDLGHAQQGQGSNPHPHGYQSGSLTTEPWRELLKYISLCTLFREVYSGEITEQRFCSF